MEYLLFGGYLILFAWLVTKVKFFSLSKLSKSQLIILFLLKVMAGILYGWIGIYYGSLAQMVDTWGFHYMSLQEYQLLQNNPAEYLTNIFYNPYDDGFYTFFSSNHSFWQNLKGNAMVKLLSIFDILSFGNYYTNIIFYAFITFFGSVSFYRVMANVFPDRKKLLMIAAFLIPSFLFWSNGIHKEGLIFTGMATVIFNTYFGLREKRFTLNRVLCILGGLFLIFVFRNFLVLTLLPAWIAWLLAAKYPGNAVRVFLINYLFFGIVFFGAKHLSPALDFPSIVVTKQMDFLKLQGGNSQVAIKEMQPNFRSFATVMPRAFVTATLRPFPGDAKNILSLAASIETNLLLLCFLCFLIRRTAPRGDPALLCFCIFFSFTTLLTIGYTVNFIGAIVRYRSLLLPLLIVPMVAKTDWGWIGKKLYAGQFNS